LGGTVKRTIAEVIRRAHQPLKIWPYSAAHYSTAPIQQRCFLLTLVHVCVHQVYFDPHAAYLPGATPSHPGLKIKFSQADLLRQFPDQFKPFLHFGCTLHGCFAGTLFRFPLRNAATAAASEIKRDAYSEADVRALFGSFREHVAETLLFLKHVLKVRRS
jgi:hypothetical protein